MWERVSTERLRPKVHRLWAKPEHFKLYKDEDADNNNGLVKDIDVRLGTVDMRAVKLGDVIEFNRDPACRRTVESIRLFSLFQDVLAKVDPSRIDPTKTPDELLARAKTMYREDIVAKYGLVAFELGK